MAVFPDRIVLKNSTDSDATIRAAIGVGGTDAIVQGELVLGLSSGSFTCYALDSNNQIKSFSSSPLSFEGDLLYYSGGVSTRLAIGSENQVLSVNSGLPAWITFNPVSGIDDLTDVDTTTVTPNIDETLRWDGTNWVPGPASSGSGGGVSGTVSRLSETQLAASGAITFTGLGASGTFVDITSDINAWIVFYPTAALRTADASRSYGVDPVVGSGVLAEFYVPGGTTVTASPGTTYFNNDTVTTDAVYAAVRDTLGNNVNATITTNAYVHQNFGGTGTNRVTDSGTASSGLLTLNGLGQTGLLAEVSSSLSAWIVFYTTSAARTADSNRSFATDPSLGSGVLAEFYIAGGGTAVATPGASYFNNDSDPFDGIYLAVRDQGGNPVNSFISVDAYAETSYSGISGGTYGSG